MKLFISIAKALSDEPRARMVMALSQGELCVCQITALLGLAPSTVSKHLSILHSAGIVRSRKDNRWVYYRLAGREADPRVKQALKWAACSLGPCAQFELDRKALVKIMKTPADELCRIQARKK